MENGYQLIDKDPTEEYQTRIKGVLKENVAIVSERTVARNPIASKLKGLVNFTRKPHPCDRW